VQRGGEPDNPRHSESAAVLTVFLATYNGADTLPRVLGSYAALEPPDGGWKLVIIDNGSDDDSQQLARSFAGRLPLQCIVEPRRGKNRALNAGLRELEGDLAVFSDDDNVPNEDWLVQLRGAAAAHSSFAVFGGAIGPLWDAQPDDWVLQCISLPAVFGITDPAWDEGPCDPARVFGGNMAVRAEYFSRGYRFDERIGPDGSSTYAMGAETELTLRLAIAEHVECWHCKAAQVRHVVSQTMTTRSWILKRAFRLGRCLYRDAHQHAVAGRPSARRRGKEIGTALARAARNLASGRARGNERQVFEARWQLHLWIGCLVEALRSWPRNAVGRAAAPQSRP